MTIVQKIKRACLPLLERGERMLQTDLRYILKGGIWITIGQTLSAASSFLLAIAFGHFVSKDDYGFYKYALSLYGVIITFSLTGLSTTVVQGVAKGFHGTLRKAFRLSLKWSWPMATAGFSAAAYYHFQGNGRLALALLMIGAFAPILRALQLYGSYYQGIKEFKTSSGYSALADIITAVSLFGTMALDPDPLLLLAVFFISYLASNAVFYAITVGRIPKDAPTDYSQVGFSKHLSLLNVLTGLAGQLDKIIVYHFLGAAPLAVYTFATAPPKQLRTAVSFIATLAIPKFANKSTEEIKRTVNKKFITSLYILVPIVAVYIVFAPYVYQVFFPKYLEAVPFSRVYVLFLLIMGNFSNIGAVVKNDVRLTYIFAAIPSFLNIVLMLALVKPFGLMGIIVALLVSKYISTAASLLLIRRLKD